ncbi:MAG: selenide, water dikinase SelD [Cyanobacteria bacterium P01_G01_bin.38]
MHPPTPIHTDLLLVGGGHTHAIVLRKIGMEGLPPGVRVTLITNLTDTPYSGMLPCHISGLYGFDDSHIDLRPLTRFANCRLFMDEMIGLDVETQQVICRDHPPVRYDVLSIDIGSTPTKSAVPGATEHAISAKPVPQLLRAWDYYVSGLEAERTATIGIVGGGVGGVELALNMQVRLWNALKQHDPKYLDKVVVHLFHRGEHLANGRSRRTQRQIEKLFRDRNLRTHLGESVCAVEPAGSQKQVRCESGLTVTCDRVFWVTNASAPDWIAQTNLSTDDKGFILVKDTLQTCSHPNIFAAGDIATLKNHPRPKAGVFAVRQGPPLHENLQRMLSGQPLKPFKPQSQYLNIIDTGTGTAIASRGPFSAESKLFRRWKDWIDGNFMALFNEFPEMGAGEQGSRGSRGSRGERVRKRGIQASNPKSSPPPSSSLSPLPTTHYPPPTPPCAGCASKVSSTVLTQTLARLKADFPDILTWPHHDNIYAGLDAPDDAAIIRVPPGKLAVHTVDHFRAMIDDPYVFGQICVNHCLSDLFAMGAAPHSVLAIATLPYATDAKQTETLYQLLSGTYQALTQSKTFLVGGHTTEGPELALGFSCNGWVDPDQILRKGGMQPGQALILTQPIGTGTLFAADMQKAAKGRWIEAAVAQMVQSNQAAVTCLRQHGVTACTDVTGFGLAGHLWEMVRASEVAVELDLSALPMLDGAQESLSAGFYSSLHARNQAVAKQIQTVRSLDHQLSYQLLFDPQTAGGLLATVPVDQMSDCLKALDAAGYGHSRCIGMTAETKPGGEPITINQW